MQVMFLSCITNYYCSNEMITADPGSSEGEKLGSIVDEDEFGMAEDDAEVNSASGRNNEETSAAADKPIGRFSNRRVVFVRLLRLVFIS